jgi:DNA-binding NarL/FixJ family response regulator
MLNFHSIDRVLSESELHKLTNILATGAEFAVLAVQSGNIKPFVHRATHSRAALSDRQRQILYLIQKGKTNREIAETLQTTRKTVKYHIERILAKLDVGNRTQAIAKAIEQHIPLGPL